MKITILSDLHIAAPHVKKGFTEESLLYEYDPQTTILTGDIVDLANAPKRNLDYWKNIIKTLEFRYKERYVLGNHEAFASKGKPYYTVIDGVVYCHGHTLYWDINKVHDWEAKLGGKGRFSRAAYTIYKTATFPQNSDYKIPPKNVLEKCKEICSDFGARAIVFGHTHSFCDIEFKGIRLVNVGRGKTVIDI